MNAGIQIHIDKTINLPNQTTIPIKPKGRAHQIEILKKQVKEDQTIEIITIDKTIEITTGQTITIDKTIITARTETTIKTEIKTDQTTTKTEAEESLYRQMYLKR